MNHAPAPAFDMAAIVLEQADRLFQLHVTPQCLAAADGGEWPEAAWRAAEEAGLPLALVPEALGGAGLPALVAALLLRRSAFFAFPAPLAETVIAAALWAEASGAVAEGPLTLSPDLDGSPRAAARRRRFPPRRWATRRALGGAGHRRTDLTPTTSRVRPISRSCRDPPTSP